MDSKTLSAEQIGQLGLQIYDKQLKEQLEKQFRGRWVAIHLENADYFIGKDAVEAARNARKKYPNETFFVTRIGDKNG